MRTHTCSELTLKHDKESVALVGWAQRIRDHGGKKFIDLRDREGITQIVFDPDVTKNFEEVESFRREYLIKVQGNVRPRPEGTVNEKHKTGEIEVIVESFEVINACDVLPFDIDTEHFTDVNEELRLEYRYLDLRRPEMYSVLRRKHKFVSAIRNFLDERDFLEVDTPNLTKSTPEGARDFLVPFRKKPGEFFALPQSPQLFKQLLMVAGVEKYFQIATCYRDEDLRKDRQYEHKQLDMEMSFLSQDEAFTLAEEMWKYAFKKAYDVELQTPFPRLTYEECVGKYGSDKPDLRITLDPLVDISSIAQGSGFGVFANNVKQGGLVKGLRLPKGQEHLTRKDIDKLIELAQRDFGAKGLAWMKVTSEGLDGSICKFFKEEELAEIKTKFSGEDGDLLFFISDSKSNTNDILDNLRRHLAERFDFMNKDAHMMHWVIDFPLFSIDEETNVLDFEHNPFCMPLEQDLDFIMNLTRETIPDNRDKILSLVSDCYDLVYNGIEISSGAQRISNPKLQTKMFELAGFTDERIEESFGWFVKAYNYGAPPHRGFGFGIERIMMIVEDKKSIREVIPFPRNKHGFDPLTNSPATVDKDQLRDLGIEIKAPKKE